MYLVSRVIALAFPVVCLLCFSFVAATLVDGPARADLQSFESIKRRDDPANTSGIEPEDETDAEIAADGTGPLRKGRCIHSDQRSRR